MVDRIPFFSFYLMVGVGGPMKHRLHLLVFRFIAWLGFFAFDVLISDMYICWWQFVFMRLNLYPY